MVQEELRYELPITENQPEPRGLGVNLLQDLNEPRPIPRHLAVFNTIVIPAPRVPGTIFLSRAVDTRNIREGEPDRSSFQVCVIDPSGNRQRLEDLVLPVDENIVNWEDPRIGPNQTLGFTVVSHEGGRYIPHPALVNVEVGDKDGNLRIIGEPQVFESRTGKNVIPLEGGFIYRPDGVSHQLHYFGPPGQLSEIIDFEKFKDIAWLSKTMGAVAKPIELGDGLKLLFIHGVRANEMGIDGRIKDDIYALGIALLDESWHVLAVDRQPFLERKHFLGNLQPEDDLNPKKAVVYSCDYLRKKNGLILPVNVGDRITVFTPISSSHLRARIKNLL